MTAPPPLTSYLFYWHHKTPASNAWHPLPGGSPVQTLTTAPSWTTRLDPLAATIDAAPPVFLTGALAHLRQRPSLGWTVPTSPFLNPLTVRATHLAALVTLPSILVLQGLGVEYRYAIPRWAHERERARDEEQARRHVGAGMGVGAVVMVARNFMMRAGTAGVRGVWPRWSLVEVVLGGAGFDLMLREYFKAHGV